jgi:probable F420-dependent oxidoreductase
MTAKLKVGLRLPSVHPADPEKFKSFIQHAEALGFNSIWAGDHVFYHVDVLQPLHLLTWAAALTSRVELGTAVMLAAYQNPVLLAKAAASLDYLSSGRLILGLSIGGTRAEYESIGVPMEQRVGRFIEGIAIMRKLWQEDNLTYVGRYQQVHSGEIRPKPAQASGIPIYVGASSEAVMRRIPRVADGWIGNGGTSVAGFLEGISFLREEAASRGRDPDSLGFAKLHGVSVHQNRDEARAIAEAHWKSYYGPRFDVETRIYGTPAECAAKLAGFAEADAREVQLILEPPSLDLNRLELLYQATENLP